HCAHVAPSANACARDSIDQNRRHAATPASPTRYRTTRVTIGVSPGVDSPTNSSTAAKTTPHNRQTASQPKASNNWRSYQRRNPLLPGEDRLFMGAGQYSAEQVCPPTA